MKNREREFDTTGKLTDLNQVPPLKSIKLKNNLLVLYDKYGFSSADVSKVAYLKITRNPGTTSEPELLFNFAANMR